ncbi:MAG: SDR family oxidoreductase [Gammaproteobacteria bacterium]|nr:MAG: SDR family oxidoreductase [Gammaproteobacteria bacterium]
MPDASIPSVLITGSNRGLGLEWARQYAAAGWRVHATCRRPQEAKALQALARSGAAVQLHRLDVTRPEEIAAVAQAVREPLDVLVLNAGVYLERERPCHLGALRYEDWLESFRVNCLGAVRVLEALVERLAASRRRLAVAIGTHMASLTDLSAPGSYYYRSSKAALHAAMRGLAHELRPRGVGVLLLHPGWVRTRMGGPQAPLEPAESVAGMRRLVDAFTLEQSGRFFRYDGTELPW